MSRHSAALTCGLLVLPTLVSVSLTAQAAPVRTAPVTQSAPAAQRVAAKNVPKTRATSAKRTPAAKTKAATTAVFGSRVVAAAGPVVDRAGRTWTRRTTGVGSWQTGTIPASVDVARTRDDNLYRKTAPGVKWYRADVPAAATYRVRLLLAEHRFTRAGERVFDVKAEGKVVARRVDIARAVGKNAAHDVTFTVPVKDGRLDLDFVAVADQPMISGVEITSTKAVAKQRPVRPKVALAPGTFFRADIRKAPLARNSDKAAAHLLRQVKGNWGGVAAFNAYRFNNSFYEVPAGQRKVRVNFYDCQRKGYTPAGLMTGAKHFVDVPIPADAVPATGSDKQLTVYDRAADKLWDFWVTEKQKDGSFRACWGGRMDDVSKNQGVFPFPYGASASGLAMTPGVISIEEFRRGTIDHAMYLAVIDAARWDRFSWPANRSDGLSTDPDALMEGQRLRLDPTLDLSKIPMTPVARMVAEAAQKYGFVVADKSGAVAVVTESGNAEKARTGRNPWDSMLAGPDYKALEGFPWEHIQVLPKDYGKPTK